MRPALASYVVAVLPTASEHTLGAVFRVRDGTNPETLHLTVGLVPTGYAWLQLAGDADLDAHVAATAAHGATGAVVGTTNAQTLTNKTLTGPAITAPTGIVKGDVGLGNVDNTGDAAKPISTATQTALDAKQPLDADLTTLAANITAAGHALVDDADAAAQRTTLGLAAGLAGDVWVEKAGDTMTGALVVGAAISGSQRLNLGTAGSLSGEIALREAGGGTIVLIVTGTGDPEGVVTADPGSIYVRVGGGAGSTLYVKNTGFGNTGWGALS